MSLDKHSILFAPAQYVTGYDVGGSETQWAFDIITQAAKRFGTVDVVLCDMRNGSFSPNVRIHAFDRGRDVNYFRPRESALFLARYTRTALRICRASPPSVLHHAFPWGARTFNPLILGRGTPFGPPKTTRVVMGPLQQPHFGLSTAAEEGFRFAPTASSAPSAADDEPQQQGLHFGILETPLRGLCKATLARADALVAISEPAKRYVQSLGVTVPVHVIPAGVRLEAFPPVDRRGRTAPLRLACVAYLIRRKNVEGVLEALARARARGRDVVLTIAGDGPEGDAMRRRIASLGLEGAVTSLGFVDNASIGRVYADADVFVTMSRLDPFPPAVIEAMASGLPVISTATDGAAALVQDSHTGFVVPLDDVEAVAAAIERYAGDAALRGQHGAAARQRIETDLSWDSVGARYAALYASLL